MAVFWEISSAALLGLMLGARHALEPDHLAAVSTLTLQAAAPWQGVALGALWGVGHTLALTGFGGVLLLLGRNVPASLERGIGLLVGALLIGLGVLSLLRALGPVQARPDRARARSATTPGLHFKRRTVLVGFVHGLGGSGALVAFLLLGMHGALARALYLLLFGLGSIAGMALLSGLLGWPAARLQKFPRLVRGLGLLAGGLSLAMGLLFISRAVQGVSPHAM